MIDREKVRQTLLKKRDELEYRVTRLNRDARKGLDRDWQEQASELANKDVREALGKEATQEIARIEKALVRLDNDRYGICAACGEQIPEARLEAYPYAERCVSCDSD